MSEQSPDIVERTDLKKYDKNLLNSAVCRLLREKYKHLSDKTLIDNEVSDLSNRGEVIREILSRGPQGVEGALAIEYAEVAKDCEREREPDNVKRRKHSRREKLLRGSDHLVMEIIETGCYL